MEGDALVAIAELDRATGRIASARATATRALDVHRETEYLLGQARAHDVLAEVMVARGRGRRARQRGTKDPHRDRQKYRTSGTVICPAVVAPGTLRR